MAVGLDLSADMIQCANENAQNKNVFNIDFVHGEIYGCTASFGREEYLLGTYWPAVNLNTEAIETWQKRNVSQILKCQSCNFDVVCGGGCAVVAANKNGGNILFSDCRPIQEIFEIGIHYYYDDFISG